MAENNNKISKKNSKNFLPEENNKLKEKEIKTGIFERQIMSLMGPFNPTPQLSEDNINKLLENDDKHDERKFKDKKGKRIFIIILSIFFGLLIIPILFIFKDNTELLKIILPSIISLAVGAFGGYGYGYKKGRDADD